MREWRLDSRNALLVDDVPPKRGGVLVAAGTDRVIYALSKLDYIQQMAKVDTKSIVQTRKPSVHTPQPTGCLQYLIATSKTSHYTTPPAGTNCERAHSRDFFRVAGWVVRWRYYVWIRR